jgi:lipopolysaccharide exporter
MTNDEGPASRWVPGRLGPATGTAVLWRGLQLVGTRIISLAKFLVLARILAPRDFGLLAIALVAVDLMLTITDFGMAFALVQREHVERPHYDTAWTVNLTRSLVIAATIAAGAPLLASLFGQPRATEILQVLALRPLIDATASIRMADLTRALRFRSLSVVRLSSAVVDATVAIAFAPTFGIWAVVLGALTGALAGSVASYVVAPYRPRLSFNAGAARSLFRFGRWLLVAGALGVAGDAVLRAVISRRLGAVDLGVYYLAVRIAILPYEAVSEIVVAVGFPVQSLLQRDRERAARVFRSTLKATLALLMPMYAIIVALAEPMVREFLGARWSAAPPVMRVIAVIAVIGTVYDATTAMLQGLGRPQWVAALAAVQLPIVSGLAWWFAGELGVTGAALARLCAEVCVQITAAVLATRLLPRPFSAMSRPIGAFVAGATAGGATALVIYRLWSDPFGVVAGAVVGMAAAAVVLLYLDRVFGLGLREDASKVFPVLMTWLRLAPTPEGRVDAGDTGAM